jgi:hypothetical protein
VGGERRAKVIGGFGEVGEREVKGGRGGGRRRGRFGRVRTTEDGHIDGHIDAIV